MELPKILVTGKFNPEDLMVSVSTSNRAIDPIIEGQIETIWNEKVKNATEAGKICYNGTSYRLNSLEENEGKLVIDFGTFAYKVRDGLTAIPEYFDLPEEYFRKGCFTTASIKTADNFYVMVELTGKSMNENVIDLVGGIMETDVEMKTGIDVFKSFYKELGEEVGVYATDITTIFLNSIYLEHRTNVGFFFEVTLNITSQELLNRFNGNRDQDIKSVRCCTKDEYRTILTNHPSPNKPFIAELLTM